MNKGAKAALIVFILILISVPAVSAFLKTSANNNKIFKGIYINNENVGEMTKEEAIGLLDEKFNKPLQEKTIKFTYQDRIFKTTFKDLNVRYNIEEAVDKALLIGKEGNIFRQTIERIKLLNSSVNITLDLSYDKTNIDKIVQKISREINKPFKDATIKLVGQNFVITKEENGIKVDEENLKSLIVDAIQNKENKEIHIPTLKVEAKIKSSDLEKIKEKISVFSTKFNPSDVNRTGNLKIAAQSLDGTVLMPGEIFSMNKVLGPRVASKGYKEAPVIINGTLVPGLAGGICQVTTTVYNAALLANFDIIERRPHGLKVSYVPPGRDATISGTSIDFKFKNTSNAPIYIKAWVSNSYVNVIFYGANENPNIKVVIESEIIERIPTTTEYIKDPTLPEGQKIVEAKPIDGVKSVTYRKIYKDGILIKKELLSKDYYKPAKGKVRIGTKKVITQTSIDDKVVEDVIESQ
ncbi:VanW family protein [Caloramator australicus]|uniref:Vancomycin B-type resistance protein VanW n=1 Tax=Caloramator australicus RC3 TaxID=857293 RepID=I7J6F6_9CLOT|nr:VanW family protein [Caloramator australicus]CCJ34459.1 Vancomycin B-type resistance protein VanW [Caloramator australicus RC3]